MRKLKRNRQLIAFHFPAYLRAGDYNVIVVDWSSIANLVYSAAAGNVPKIAERVTEMLNYLKAEFGLNFSTTQLVGHSLGAHVAGLAARCGGGCCRAVLRLGMAHWPTRGGECEWLAGTRLHRDPRWGGDVLSLQLQRGRTRRLEGGGVSLLADLLRGPARLDLPRGTP